MGSGGQRRKRAKTSVKSKIYAIAAALGLLVAHRTVYADDAAGQAGALLAAGRLSEAADAVRACADPRCSLVLGRALFGLKRLPEAAQALSAARSGVLAPYAAVLQGEALLLAGRPLWTGAIGMDEPEIKFPEVQLLPGKNVFTIKTDQPPKVVGGELTRTIVCSLRNLEIRFLRFAP